MLNSAKQPSAHLDIMATVGQTIEYSCGDRHIVKTVAIDADTLRPLIVHHPIDDDRLCFVGRPDPVWPNKKFHANIKRHSRVSLLANLPAIVGYKYRHFKGGEYVVVCVAYDEATMERMVIYRSLVDTSETPWARYYDTGPSPWYGSVTVAVPRFALLP